MTQDNLYTFTSYIFLLFWSLQLLHILHLKFVINFIFFFIVSGQQVQYELEANEDSAGGIFVIDFQVTKIEYVLTTFREQILNIYHRLSGNKIEYVLTTFR